MRRPNRPSRLRASVGGAGGSATSPTEMATSTKKRRRIVTPRDFRLRCYQHSMAESVPCEARGSLHCGQFAHRHQAWKQLPVCGQIDEENGLAPVENTFDSCSYHIESGFCRDRFAG